MSAYSFIPLAEIRRVRAAAKGLARAEALADVFRLNALYMIARAGSGHVGTSFSAIDAMTYLWSEVLERPNERGGADTFFSSKGHDAPALYAVLTGFEKFDFEMIHSLRRLGGLPGHPDVGTPFVAANTGSLGMGISKARGIAAANRLAGKRARVFVLCGDGELQEGQIWESLGPAANGKFSEITVLVDHNKIQSDTWVRDVSDLGAIEEKFRAFGWAAARAAGHDLAAIEKALRALDAETGKPRVLVLDTVKGAGVSFMKDPEKTPDGEYYRFHSGAPSDADVERAFVEILARANARLARLGLAALSPERREAPARPTFTKPQRLVPAYGDELLSLARQNPSIVVLDADLVLDCGLVKAKSELRDRFIECGIAEQDMVSTASGLALEKKLPIVHSFACFLTSRAHEQIYNAATERTKIIYAGSLAGLLPATPGHSHQSLRDIASLKAVPGLTLLSPSCEAEARLAIRWAVSENPRSTYLRLESVPCELSIDLPASYRLEKGKGVQLVAGSDAVIFGYGPVLLREACLAAEILERRDRVKVAVVNLPWLNTVDSYWLGRCVEGVPAIFTLDNHDLAGGQGEMIAANLAETGALASKKIWRWGVSGMPACGQSAEVLRFHKLDAESLANRVIEALAEHRSEVAG